MNRSLVFFSLFLALGQTVFAFGETAPEFDAASAAVTLKLPRLPLSGGGSVVVGDKNNPKFYTSDKCGQGQESEAGPVIFECSGPFYVVGLHPLVSGESPLTIKATVSLYVNMRIGEPLPQPKQLNCEGTATDSIVLVCR